MAVSDVELRHALDNVRKILDNIEKKLQDRPSEDIDPYVRRRQILMRIYWADNSMRRDELMQLLADYGTNYAWIGQQVKKGYLTVAPAPGGYRYSVTEKAVEEQQLEDDEEAEVSELTRASWEVFAEDWDSDEDAIYDTL